MPRIHAVSIREKLTMSPRTRILIFSIAPHAYAFLRRYSWSVDKPRSINSRNKSDDLGVLARSARESHEVFLAGAAHTDGLDDMPRADDDGPKSHQSTSATDSRFPAPCAI